jgi:hypothetical protein
VIKSYKFPSTARNQRLIFALKNIAKIESKTGFVDKFELAKETKRSLKSCAYYLVDLKKSNLIKAVEKPRKQKGYPLCWKYKLTKLGWIEIRKFNK